MSRLLPALCLVAILGGCHRKKAHGPAPADAAASPSFSLTSAEIQFGDSVKGTDFNVHGRGCKKLEAALWHITADAATAQTTRTFADLPESFEGRLCLLAQKGEPFGMKDQRVYVLGESIPAALKTQSSVDPAVLRGPYPGEIQERDSQRTYGAATEHVVLAICLAGKRDSHSLGSRTLEALKKHAAETKDEIIAVTIRWEP